MTGNAEQCPGLLFVQQTAAQIGQQSADQYLPSIEEIEEELSRELSASESSKGGQE